MNGGGKIKKHGSRRIIKWESKVSVFLGNIAVANQCRILKKFGLCYRRFLRSKTSAISAVSAGQLVCAAN